MENDELIPVVTTLSPAPEAVIQLVKCGSWMCKGTMLDKSLSVPLKAGLICTDLCSCSDDDHECENQLGQCDDDDSDIENEEDGDSFISLN